LMVWNLFLGCCTVWIWAVLLICPWYMLPTSSGLDEYGESVFMYTHVIFQETHGEEWSRSPVWVQRDSGEANFYTRWFKYNRNWVRLVYTQISPGHIWITLYKRPLLGSPNASKP
jgi:hypothetical protein